MFHHKSSIIRGRVFHQDFQIPRSGLKKWGTAECFELVLRCRIPEETIYQVFDEFFFNSLIILRKNSKQKVAKFCDN